MDKKEYIERGALKQKKVYSVERHERVVPVAEIDWMPAADVVEVRHGEWKKRGNEKKCSVCDFIYYSNNDEWTYCPNCGAKMDATDNNVGDKERKDKP